MDRTFASRVLSFLCLLATVLVSVGCGARADSKPELTVFAASSLTDAFGELGEEFERRNPGAEVRFSFAGSSVLLAQMQQGAPADVFASADEAKMQTAVEAGLVREPRIFAKNSPTVILPAGNPGGVETLRDLTQPDLDLVLAQEGVPIAGYARAVLAKASRQYGGSFGERVTENVVSREADVRTAANRVALGEADATFVYASDLTTGVRDRVEVVEIPKGLNVIATYPIAVAEDAPNRELAREWVELVLNEEGQRALEEWGLRRAR